MNILIVTPIFPALDIFRETADDPSTKFLYFYAREWVRQGHQVVVLHTIPAFPSLFNKLVALLERRLGWTVLDLSRYDRPRAIYTRSHYSTEGIEVFRIPIPKYFPHRELLSCHLAKLGDLTRSASEEFQFDLIISDFLSPSLYVSEQLSKVRDVPNFVIVHAKDVGYLKRYKGRMIKRLSEVSQLLFRSRSLAEHFARECTDLPSSRLMTSGIPDSISLGEPRTSVCRLLFVGGLRKTKNIHTILYAIKELREKGINLELELIGGGEYENALRSLVERLGLQNCVTFVGKVLYEKVFEHMRRADALVMVSKETFGMVYIEAMSQGCIVVAAKGQGIDGVVLHQHNGFLIELGDVHGLTSLLLHISCLPASEIKAISTRSIETAANMRHDVLARELLEGLTNGNQSPGCIRGREFAMHLPKTQADAVEPRAIEGN